MLEIFLHWTVISAVVTGLIGVGVSVMRTSPPAFTAAKWCFSAAYLILLLRLSWWMGVEQTEGMPTLSTIHIFLVLGFIGLLWVGAMRWVDAQLPGDLSGMAEYSKGRALEERIKFPDV